MAEWLSPQQWIETVRASTEADVQGALEARNPGIRDFCALVSEPAGRVLEAIATKARALTRRHFGRTVSLYVPLYVSNYCHGGCAYCGFASDRTQVRHKLSISRVRRECAAIKALGLDDILLLTGERTLEADLDYLEACVQAAASTVDRLAVEAFAMEEDEYRRLAAGGCTGITLYQETYDPRVYGEVHRWGEKRDYGFRLEGPERAFRAGMRTVGIGALYGLADPLYDAIGVYQHAVHLRKVAWQGGVSVSFPRLRPESGGFEPRHPVTSRRLAQIIWAFRVCLPDVPLVLSTRESPAFRDGMAGVGISTMSVASRTTVGGYTDQGAVDEGQFEVEDRRSVESFCKVLETKGLEPVFKNWDAVYR